jgi:hypothetical protein
MGERVAGIFEFHPAHNHWHIGDVALFEVRKGNPYTGEIVGGNSLKTTFCLVDSYRLMMNSPTSQRVFWDCYASYQGIASGWVDQYHQATPDQEVVLTGSRTGTTTTSSRPRTTTGCSPRRTTRTTPRGSASASRRRARGTARSR